jgi:hypothetical protein
MAEELVGDRLGDLLDALLHVLEELVQVLVEQLPTSRYCSEDVVRPSSRTARLGRPATAPRAGASRR